MSARAEIVEPEDRRGTRIDVAHRHAGDVAVAVHRAAAERLPVEVITDLDGDVVGDDADIGPLLAGLPRAHDELVEGGGASGGHLVGAGLVVALGLGGQAQRLGGLDLRDHRRRLDRGHVLPRDLDGAVRADHERHAVLRRGHLGGVGRLVRDHGGHDGDVHDGGRRRLGVGRGDEDGGEEVGSDESDHGGDLWQEPILPDSAGVEQERNTSFEGVFCARIPGESLYSIALHDPLL